MDAEFFIYRKPKNAAAKAFLLCLSSFGMLSMFFYPLMGSIMCIVAGLSTIAQSGFILDTDNRRYKSVIFLRKLSFADWRELPPCDYLSVFSTTMVSATSSLSGRYVAIKSKVVKVNLVYDRNKRLTVFQTEDFAQAYAAAEIIAASLGAAIYNADERLWTRLGDARERTVENETLLQIENRTIAQTEIPKQRMLNTEHHPIGLGCA